MGTRALILAAGRGSRLGASGEELPKPLLQIGGKTLAERQLEMLADAGVGPAAMVVGYRSDEVMETVGMRAEFLRNPKWAQTNSLYSFLMAREWAQEDLLVLNCDLLTHPEILNRLLSAGSDSIAFDSSSGDGREHMKVSVDGGRLTAMGKELPPEEISGENVGMLYLSRDTVALLMEEAQRCVDEGRMTDWLGTAVNRISNRRELRAVDIAGLPWAEIDFAVDLDRARKEILPLLDRRPARQFGVRALVGAVLVTVLVAGAFFQASSRPSDEAKVQWNTVAPLAQDPVQLETRGGAQQWWLVESGASLEISVRGPARLRVESRLLLAESEPSPYLLEFSADGRVLDWRRNKSEQSGSANFDGSPVCKRERDHVKIPEDAAQLRIRVESQSGNPVLVRVRAEETDLGDEG